MAEPDNDDSTSLLGEALEKLMAAEDGESDELTQTNEILEFHRFVDLPAELRDQIRKEAIRQEGFGRRNKLSPWATVCKEWQDDVEKIIFSRIEIDPANGEDGSKFKEIFIQRRRRFLTCLSIIIDDREPGAWHSVMGLSQISLLMEKIGQIFQFISSWDLDRDKDRKEPPGMEIYLFCLGLHFSEFDSADPFDPTFQTTSLWTESQLDLLTNSNLLPTNMPLWAIRAEFPKTFSIANCLTFPLDCVPLPAAMAIMETMPNLTTCSFDLRFEKTCLQGIENLTEFVRRLPVMAPSLRELFIRNAYDGFVPDSATYSIKNLTAALRDYSQNLESLGICNFHLHQTFFQPFMDENEAGMAMARWTWPKLKKVFLDFGTFGPYGDPGQLSLTAVDLLTAAGRAATNMPALEYFDVTATATDGPEYDFGTFYRIELKVSGNPEDYGKSRVSLWGFDEEEEQRTLAAWTPFMGAEARFVRWKLDTEDSDSEDSDYEDSDYEDSDYEDSDYEGSDYSESDDVEPVAVVPTRSNASRIFEASPTTMV